MSGYDARGTLIIRYADYWRIRETWFERAGLTALGREFFGREVTSFTR